MLIQTPLKSGDTVSMKLVSGEEIIARFEEDSEKGFTVKNPLTLAQTPQGIGLVPFMFTVEPTGKFTFKHEHILTSNKTEEQMSKQYIQSTTGLKV